jgi:hypothetical protein
VAFSKLKFAILVSVLCLHVAAQNAGAQTSSARDSFRQAFELAQKGENAAALLLYEQGLALDGKDATAWQFYGDSLLKLEKRSAARQAYRRSAILHTDASKKAIAQSRADAVKLSVYPGQQCEAAVTASIDPSLLTQFLPLVTDTIDVEVDFKVILPENNIVRGTAEITQCGDIYQVTKVKGSPDSGTVTVIGVPRLRFSTGKDGKARERVTSLVATSDESNRLKNLKYETTGFLFMPTPIPNKVECILSGIAVDTASPSAALNGEVLKYQCRSETANSKTEQSLFFSRRYSVVLSSDSTVDGGKRTVEQAAVSRELSPVFVK